LRLHDGGAGNGAKDLGRGDVGRRSVWKFEVGAAVVNAPSPAVEAPPAVGGGWQKRYGHCSTAWRRLERRGEGGVRPKVAGALASKGCSMGKPSLSRASIGSTAVEARKGLHH
jgi:hypothetical protein